MKYTFRPLRWTGPSTPIDARRSRWTFRASWSNTVSLLARELDHLDAVDVVIEADFREQDLRLDGMPRSNARQPAHPGVRLAFGSKFGPLIYSTDAYEFWQHNVRAIALGLEALRAVDRYGVTKRGEQYTGWKALPAGASAQAPMNRDDAARALGVLAGWTTPPDSADPAVVQLAFRTAARRTHPDLGGSAGDFQRLQDVMRILTGGTS